MSASPNTGPEAQITLFQHFAAPEALLRGRREADTCNVRSMAMRNKIGKRDGVLWGASFGRPGRALTRMPAQTAAQTRSAPSWKWSNVDSAECSRHIAAGVRWALLVHAVTGT